MKNERTLKVAIIGTRGIPNNYGGFEQFAEYLSVGLVQKGFNVTVYSPHFHPYRKTEYKGVRIKHIYSPENLIGSALGSFFYDFLSLKEALKKGNFDIIYEAGYTSIVPAYIFFNVKKINCPVFVTNMDGLEWRRSKFKKIVQNFIHWEEKKTVDYSKFLIADNQGIQDYYLKNYNKKCYYIPYGADIYNNYSESFLTNYNLIANSYFLVIARIEPENNIEMIIDGYIFSGEKKISLVIVGKKNTSHAKYLIKKYKNNKNVLFTGGIYNFDEINSIRHYCKAYFHGHSVGGTNPSLLEAMASECFIISHDNPFNRSVIKDNALFFSNSIEICNFLKSEQIHHEKLRTEYILNNLANVKENYLWEKIINGYELYFKKIIDN